MANAGLRTITGAGTATAAFVAPIEGGGSQPRRVGSWHEFTKHQGETASSNLAEAVYGFFANGGRVCYVAATAGDGLGAYTAALTALEDVADVNSVVLPDLWRSEADVPAIAKAAAGHCARANRMALLHAKQEASASDAVKVPALFGLDEDEAAFTTVYYPWVKVPGVGGAERVVPPSGHVAGVWARTDAERGVFKAPVNQPVRGAADLTVQLTNADQEPLNEVGVNCLRVISGQGLRVWGARTLSRGGDWKYVSVRRLANFLIESVRTSTTWAAFEPNDATLQASLRASVTTFLTDQWRQGALVGSTPDTAFFVVCDESNNPPESVAAGKVVMDIGVAPVRPAEFIRLPIVQNTGTGQ
ncbi:phage tail sheath subtilisin-like domain-containing protein [Streptomyces sp. MZ04]|uniref:phage tail sheath family protein n=1 Tax=Streptomyces sp. MZ04 TaxID=2559236 RepID=UPI00107E7BE8|nr:phage tail sheath subtilisin-like domain-containing protein [Streptomyces sp. MZ04]TGB16091.1 phage tail sheath family protein [Streptomyces sp. MZ04]